MKGKKTQKQRVIDELLRSGLVRRNWALDGRITRLGAIIEDLEQHDGFVFEARYSKDGKDYGYILKSCPLKKEVYTVGDKVITTYKK